MAKDTNLSVGRGEKLPVSKGGGLTAKGRRKYNRATGSKLKAPQKSGPRHKSFCARSKNWKGERGKAASLGCTTGTATSTWRCRRPWWATSWASLRPPAKSPSTRRRTSPGGRRRRTPRLASLADSAERPGRPKAGEGEGFFPLSPKLEEEKGGLHDYGKPCRATPLRGHGKYTPCPPCSSASR